MNELVLARKYARAYMAVFGAELPEDFLEKMQAVYEYVTAHREAFFYVKLSLIPAAIKEHILLRAFDRTFHGMVPGYKQLIRLLAEHHRLHLIARVIAALCQEYTYIHGLEEFTITAAQTLDEHQIQEIACALEALTHKKIKINIEKDESLIAGIRALSDVHKWEYSVRQMLRDYRRPR